MNVMDEVRVLSPQIRELGRSIDESGAVPLEVIDRLRKAGVFRLAVPSRFGGSQTEPNELVEILEELSCADGAVGWCAMIGAVTGIALAYLPGEVAAPMARDERFLIVGVASPMGKATPDGSGYRLSGRWAFASGSRHATWLVAGAFTPEGVRMFVLEASTVEIHETWQVMGLTGTGSHDFSVEDAFVPADRVFSLNTQPREEGALYRFSPNTTLSLGLASVALGIARAAIEDFVELVRARRDPVTGKSRADKASVQTAVAEATALHRSGLAYLQQELSTPGLDESRRAAQRLAIATAARNAARAVDLMYNAAGGGAVYLSSPLQRHFRNVHAATQHAMLSTDVVEAAGSVLLGGDAKEYM